MHREIESVIADTKEFVVMKDAGYYLDLPEKEGSSDYCIIEIIIKNIPCQRKFFCFYSSLVSPFLFRLKKIQGQK